MLIMCQDEHKTNSTSPLLQINKNEHELLLTVVKKIKSIFAKSVNV